MPSTVTLIPQVSLYNEALSQPLTLSQRRHILIIFQKRCCLPCYDKGIYIYIYTILKNFYVFFLLSKSKYTNFRAVSR